MNKNDVTANIFDNGAVRFDFGRSISDDLKKKASQWAKKRGLKVVEESLGKSQDGSSYIIFGNQAGTTIIQSYKIDLSK